MGILSRRQRLGTAAILLACSAFLSRLMGLIRDKIISWQFGAGSEADMYFAAFVVPDIINYLLAGGFMSITIIPLLANAFRQNEEDAWRFFSCVFFWITLAACLFTAVCELFAPHLAKLIAPGFDTAQCHRLAFFMRIILPGQIFFLSGACFTALLLLRRQFTVPALTPLIYNGAIIICGLAMPLFFKNDADFGMTGYCAGVTIGAALGAFFLPLCVAAKGKLRISPVLSHPYMIKFIIIALPLMLGQTVVMLDEQFLRVFGSFLGEGWVSLLNYGRRIAQVPVAFMGQALAAASYPFLVSLLAQHEENRFNETMRSALIAGISLIIPCSFLMIAASTPILGAIFQGGRFGLPETLACAPLTRIMLLPAPFWILYMVLARGFYAYEDTLTPAITGTIITVICIPCYYFLAVPLGAWAIAIVSGAGVTAYSLWLLEIWIKRHGSAAFNGVGRLASQYALLSFPPAILAWFSLRIFENHYPYTSFFILALALFIATAIFCASFVVITRFFTPGLFRTLLLNLKRLL